MQLYVGSPAQMPCSCSATEVDYTKTCALLVTSHTCAMERVYAGLRLSAAADNLLFNANMPGFPYRHPYFTKTAAYHVLGTRYATLMHLLNTPSRRLVFFSLLGDEKSMSTTHSLQRGRPSHTPSGPPRATATLIE